MVCFTPVFAVSQFNSVIQQDALPAIYRCHVVSVTFLSAGDGGLFTVVVMTGFLSFFRFPFFIYLFFFKFVIQDFQFSFQVYQCLQRDVSGGLNRVIWFECLCLYRERAIFFLIIISEHFSQSKVRIFCIRSLKNSTCI